jgi:hypothetical protein
MVQKFFSTFWWNTILAVIAAVLSIMQEVWLGTAFEFLNFFVLGSAVAFGFSWSASVIGYLTYRIRLIWKNIWIGTAVGVVAALLTVLLI